MLNKCARRENNENQNHNRDGENYAGTLAMMMRDQMKINLRRF